MKFPVSEAKSNELRRRMEALGLREEDLLEEFIRGSGAGGQKINKTSVVVQITHIPTAMTVRCQAGRSQVMNRFLARRLLVEKLEEKIFQEESVRQKQIEKIRRQKRKRSRKAKEKLLKAKHHRTEIKNLRKKPETED